MITRSTHDLEERLSAYLGNLGQLNSLVAYATKTNIGLSGDVSV